MTAMPRNRFKARLLAGEVQFGIFCGIGSPVTAEIVAGAGFDWMLIDCEHAPNDAAAVLAQLQAASAYDTSVLVRPETADRVVIKRLLDVGMQTILAPMVESAAQAREIVAATRYPPAGVRGVGPSLARAARWNRVDQYLDSADDEMCVLCQIETRRGLDSIEEIVAVEGVDALFIGPSDLAADMGHRGRSDHPAVADAIDRAAARIAGAGGRTGIFASSPSAATSWATRGATVIAAGSDTVLLARATADLAAGLARG